MLRKPHNQARRARFPVKYASDEKMAILGASRMVKQSEANRILGRQELMRLLFFSTKVSIPDYERAEHLINRLCPE
jgi:hypothetical protein